VPTRVNGMEEFILCLGCGNETTKKRRRLLSDDHDSVNIWSLLRRHYSSLMVQQNVRIAYDYVHNKLTANDPRNLNVYLCESCWKILCNFYKKEAAIRESIKKALSLLPTVQEEVSTNHTVQYEQNTQTVLAGQNTQTVLAGQNIELETVPTGQNTQTMLAGENTQTVLAGQNTQTVLAGQNIELETVLAGQSTETVLAGQSDLLVPLPATPQCTEIHTPMTMLQTPSRKRALRKQPQPPAKRKRRCRHGVKMKVSLKN